MCIICNLTTDEDPIGGAMLASQFLNDFEAARVAIEKAATSMHAVALKAPDRADQDRYKAMHKRMVRMKRDWARLEQVREAKQPTQEGS